MASSSWLGLTFHELEDLGCRLSFTLILQIKEGGKSGLGVRQEEGANMC